MSEGLSHASTIPGASAPAPGGSATGGTQGRVAKVLYLSFLLMLTNGMPLTVIGVPEYQGIMLQQTLIFLGMALRVYFVFTERATFDYWEKVIIWFVAYCLLVSFISNTFLIPQPLWGWLPGIIEIMPLFLIATCKTFGYTVEDVIDALLLTAATGAVLTVIETFYKLPFLEYAIRRSSQSISDTRLVLFKNESVYSLAICVTRLLTSKIPFHQLIYAIALVLFAYVLFVVQESRLAIAAAMIGSLMYIVFIYKGRSKFAILTITSVVIALLCITILSKYFLYASQVSNYATQDVSTRYRILEGVYFYFYFLQTHGLGFGMMKITPNSSNLLSFGMNAAGFVLARNAYPVGLADIGIFAALFQYGYIGLASILYMTFKACWTLWKNARVLGYKWRNEVGAVGAVAFSFMLSPLPMNFFTLQFQMPIGALLWFLAYRSSADVARLRSTASKQ